MRGVSRAETAGARRTVRPVDRETDQLAGTVLKDIAYMLWPQYTAQCLADEIGKARGNKCDPRVAERYLGGQRDWSGDVVAVVVTEILKRHAMRNVKVAKRK
jgi:hypothetical protein